MKKKILAANWKMNFDIEKVRNYIESFLEEKEKLFFDAELIFFPPSVYIYELYKVIKNKKDIFVGVQNIFYEDFGAFTGEISAKIAKSVGARYVIVGHSERINIFGESYELISKKLNSAFCNNLTPIICVGEKVGESREESVVLQLEKFLGKNFDELNFGKFFIAYEPFGSIGSDITPDIKEIEKVILNIKEWLFDNFKNLENKVHFLYGGSCNEFNCSNIISSSIIDGLLVGRASLEVDKFIKIMKNF